MDDIARAISLLQDFTLGNVAPGDMVATIARLVNADSACLSPSSETFAGVMPFAGFNFSEATLREYAERYASRDEQLQAIVRKYGRSPPLVFSGEDVLPDAAFARSEVYNDFFRKINVRHAIRLDSGALPGQGMDRVGLYLARGRRRGAFRTSEKRVLEKLAPFFRSAMTDWSFARARANASLAAAFENAADAMAILDADGRQRYANASFETFRRLLSPGGNGDGSRPLDAAPLGAVRTLFQQSLRDAQSASMAARQGRLSVKAQGSVRCFLASISTVQTSAGVAARHGERLFVLVLREESDFQQKRFIELQRRFALTAAQMRVLALLMQGQNLREIGTRLQLSVHTVRLHVKALMAKTDCRRQAQLVQLVEKVTGAGLRILV